jgi:hypothetical protein
MCIFCEAFMGLCPNGQGAEAPSSGAPDELRGPFLVLSVPVDGLSAILTGVGDHIAEPEREHHDGNNPENMDGKTHEASQEGDRKDRYHHNVRYPALTE